MRRLLLLVGFLVVAGVWIAYVWVRTLSEATRAFEEERG